MKYDHTGTFNALSSILFRLFSSKQERLELFNTALEVEYVAGKTDALESMLKELEGEKQRLENHDI